jgi:hypothetical protein
MDVSITGGAAVTKDAVTAFAVNPFRPFSLVDRVGWFDPDERLYATEQIADPTVYVKLFTPDSNWTWFLTEYGPEQRLGFGLAKGLETELGCFSLSELEAVRGPLGLPVERDLHWQHRPLSECQKE